MRKKKKSKQLRLPGVRYPKRPNRVLIAGEAKRLPLWRAEAKRHNVSLATWIRWACDAAVDNRPERLHVPPTGEVLEDGTQF